MKDIIDIYIQEQKILKGIVKKIVYSKDDKVSLIIDFKGFIGIIKEENIDIYTLKNKCSLEKMIGTNINFVITNINEDGTLECSRRIYREMIKDRLILDLKNNKVLDGVVYKVYNNGAYLMINRIIVILKNSDFSTDNTPVMNVLKVGDVIPVKFNKISECDGKIFVQAKNKYTSKKNMLNEKDINRLIEMTTLYSLINNTKAIDDLLKDLDEETAKYVLSQAKFKGGKAVMSAMPEHLKNMENKMKDVLHRN